MLKPVAVWGGSVLMVAAVALGALDTPDATRAIVAWASPFGVSTIHVAFWALAVGAIWTATAQGLRIRSLTARQPVITIEPLVANERATLVVRNSGGKAEFTAKARVRDTSLVGPEWYTMYWESESHKTSVNIDRDGLQSILVGRASDYFDEKRFIFPDGLILYKMGGEGEQEFGCLTGVTRRIDATTAEGWAEDRCAVDVLITAEPSLAKPFGAQYSVERVRGMEGVRLTCLTCESPVLNVWGV